MPVCDIARQFWSWWAHLNAPARSSTTPDGRFAPGVNGDKIAIETLRIPGKNGWLGLLYLLMVWRKTIADGDATDWEMVVADMAWVTH
jgi:hypothetical protein